MNRRGILGAIVGAPIAAPEVARNFAQAAQKQNYASLNVGSMGLTQSGIAGNAMRMMEPDDAIRKAFSMGLVSREKLSELLAGMTLTSAGQVVSVYNLDADLQAAKSYSLATRIRMQRERNLDREITKFLNKPKSFWDFGRDLIAKGLVGEDAA